MNFKVGDIVQHKKFKLRFLILEAEYWGYKMENLRDKEKEKFPLQEAHKDYILIQTQDQDHRSE